MTTSYSVSGFWRGVVIATVVAGTLDILSAFLFDMLVKGTPVGVLNGIAAAALPQVDMGGMGDMGDIASAALGLIVHFAIMFVMVAVYFTFAARTRLLNHHVWISGIGYGLILWGVMYWGMLPWRFPTLFPILDPQEVAMQLFSHIVLVGLPIALIARRAARWHAAEW
ncbi:MAG: hypothetical protein JWL96_3716 [Sphingomonas bacterium]|uniref:hypothetical protein n=1 Tax=Sphingomonas bacterium TaxID=1895847 RepID=UPI002639EBBD|nr:hypothetical protein [Sphingomonas bacterium]MDB5711646.1 hypothetical protein [Sphingomonas bacterium]